MTDLSRPGLLAAVNHWRYILTQPEDVLPARDVAAEMIALSSALLSSHADRENLIDANRVLRRQLARVASERDCALGRVKRPRKGARR